jgi:hypothetical protein
MDRLEIYREKVKELLNKYSRIEPSYGEVAREQIFDTERDRYQVLTIGWNKQKRVYGTMMHLDIKNNKVWIQENTTEFDLANELVEMGIPKQDIVIGFNTPKMREMTDFAIG